MLLLASLIVYRSSNSKRGHGSTAMDISGIDMQHIASALSLYLSFLLQAATQCSLLRSFCKKGVVEEHTRGIHDGENVIASYACLAEYLRSFARSWGLPGLTG